MTHEEDSKGQLRDIFIACTKSDVRVNNMMSRARPPSGALNNSQVCCSHVFDLGSWSALFLPRTLKIVKAKAKPKAKSAPSAPSQKRSGAAQGEPGSQAKVPKKKAKAKPSK